MPRRDELPRLSGGGDITAYYEQQGDLLADEERQSAIDRFVPYERYQLDPPKPEQTGGK